MMFKLSHMIVLKRFWLTLLLLIISTSLLNIGVSVKNLSLTLMLSPTALEMNQIICSRRVVSSVFINLAIEPVIPYSFFKSSRIVSSLPNAKLVNIQEFSIYKLVNIQEFSIYKLKISFLLKYLLRIFIW
jgi:hypothetical protein